MEDKNEVLMNRFAVSLRLDSPFGWNDVREIFRRACSLMRQAAHENRAF